MNVGSWETSELSTLIVCLLRTTGAALIVKNTVDEIILIQKVSATNHEAPEFLDSDYNTNHFYKFNKMRLEYTKENLD